MYIISCDVKQSVLRRRSERGISASMVSLDEEEWFFHSISDPARALHLGLLIGWYIRNKLALHHAERIQIRGDLLGSIDSILCSIRFHNFIQQLNKFIWIHIDSIWIRLQWIEDLNNLFQRFDHRIDDHDIVDDRDISCDIQQSDSCASSLRRARPISTDMVSLDEEWIRYPISHERFISDSWFVIYSLRSLHQK